MRTVELPAPDAIPRSDSRRGPASHPVDSELAETPMRDAAELTGSDRAYAVAHAAHYSERNLAAALQLYRELIASRPNAPEARYSRAQIQNIIDAVVPLWERLDAQIALAQARLGCKEPT